MQYTIFSNDYSHTSYISKKFCFFIILLYNLLPINNVVQFITFHCFYQIHILPTILCLICILIKYIKKVNFLLH